MAVCAKEGCKGVVTGDPLTKRKLAFGWERAGVGNPALGQEKDQV